MSMSEPTTRNARERPERDVARPEAAAAAAFARRRAGRAGGAAVGRDRRGDAAAPGHDACGRRAHSGTRICRARRQGGGDRRQFAGRLAGAVAPDPQSHPSACDREEAAGADVRRGCGGKRRLHDRLRRRRDFLRSVVDRRLHRRGRRFVRLPGVDRKDRHRAAPVHLGQEQGDARSVSARESRRRARG